MTAMAGTTDPQAHTKITGLPDTAHDEGHPGEMTVTTASPESDVAPRGTRTARRVGIVVAALVVLLALTLIAGYGWWRYEKVYAYDDYLRGYALGEHWHATDRKGNCETDARRLYPSTSAHPFPRGLNAFRAGCADGLEGVPASGWTLHDRLAVMAD
jgi:hypothetical protein